MPALLNWPSIFSLNETSDDGIMISRMVLDAYNADHENFTSVRN